MKNDEGPCLLKCVRCWCLVWGVASAALAAKDDA